MTEHTNIQELKAIEDELRRRTEEGEHDLRIVVCCDSRVVVGALANGRTSSRSLSVSLRKRCVRYIDLFAYDWMHCYVENGVFDKGERS